jgi:hypothetical protein
VLVTDAGLVLVAVADVLVTGAGALVTGAGLVTTLVTALVALGGLHQGGRDGEEHGCDQEVLHGKPGG